MSTPPYHKAAIHHNAVLSEKPEVTQAAWEVTHEAAQMKLEIQYVCPLLGMEQRRISSLFERRAVTERADPLPCSCVWEQESVRLDMIY